MKRILAVFLCLCIAFLPAIGHAGAGTKLPGFYKPLTPPLPRPALPKTTAGQPQLNLTVAPKNVTQLPGLYKSLAPPIPRPKSANATNLTVAAKSNTAPASNELPVNKDIVQGISSISVDSSKNKMVIQQNQSQAIIDWWKFNIGSNAWVQFDQQKNPSWVCLNRIWSQDPSQIFGKLTADGKIYLINQNGILFGQGSQVNTHTLIASSLDISNNDFLAGKLNFQAQDYITGTSAPNLTAFVTNQGTITTDTLGSVFLLAPNVENDGAISTTAGQIGLAAGSSMGLSYVSGGASTVLAVNVNTAAGDVTNSESGVMSANTGLIGMYGKNVYQNGIISAVTALKQNGQIELIASDEVSTGTNSITSSPISSSSDTADPSFTFHPALITMSGNKIDLQGAVVAHSGIVNLNAQERVFVDNGSSVNVSGSWENKPASANTTSVQLNSVNLRDDYGQKDGILKGKYITFDNRFGSSIGDVSGSLTTQAATALDRSLLGGTINISAPAGDVIVKQGASLNFSGGGVQYSAGNITTTKLISGNKLYDISNAPEYLNYTNMLNAVQYVDGYVQGASAGSLFILQAKQVTLDGTLKGSVTRGAYQTQTAELKSAAGNQKTLGVAEPVGGTLVIGTQPSIGNLPNDQDFSIDQVFIKQVVAPLPADFGPDDNLYTGFRSSVLSAKMLSATGLNSLEISCNTSFTTEQGALIALQPGGSFTAYAREIVHEGKISVPAGTISLTSIDNFTSFVNNNPAYNLPPSRVYLGDTSVLSVAGERIDNSVAWMLTAGQPIRSGLIQGGHIYVKDDSYQGQGVFMKQGALIDVSGGYQIDQKAKVTGGNAGTLGVQGRAILLDGNLRGYSLTGNNGGQIVLLADNVFVAPSAPPLPANFNSDSVVPADLQDKLVFAANSLDKTGFTQIELDSVNNLTVQNGATLSPSLVKLAAPTPGQTASGGLVSVSPDLIGISSFKAAAGLLFENSNPFAQPNTSATVTTEAGSAIHVAPGSGSISISAPGSIDLAGLLDAPSGNINITTANSLTVEAGGSILAQGYNKIDIAPVIAGVPLGFTPLAGGTVTLAGAGLILDPGSLVDVSGSAQATKYILTADGAPLSVTVAGSPGSISLLSSGTLTISGELKARAQMAGIQGGSLKIALSNPNGTLTLSRGDLNRYITDGFDALTFRSITSLTLSGSMDLNIGRSLTLDAPEIIGSGSDVIALKAPQIELTNSYYPLQGRPGGGSAKLSLSGGWLDISGSMNLSGFSDVTLVSAHDLTLTETPYAPSGGTFQWGGTLQTAGNLTLRADRIYPAMQSDNTPSDYTIISGGTFTTLPGNDSGQGPIYSAGGSLTIQAAAIDHEGYLAAPMGSITLTAVGGNNEAARVYLAQGSTITTKGSALVDYGTLNDVFWTVTDKTKNTSGQVANVQNVPAKSVTITGDQVIMKSGSKIDISGSGGGIFAYQFQAGIQGSVDPFQVPGRYVIVPSGKYSLPGKAIYLEGGPGLPAGVYSILPEQYAFLPGAMVITNTGVNVASGTHEVSADGFSVVAGCFTYAGTSIRPPLMQAFEVQPASYLLTQGDFSNTSKFIAGNGGNLALTGTTATVVNGKINAAGLNGYQGGAISLSGASAEIGATTAQLLNDSLFISAGALSGFKEIDITASADSITIDPGAVLQATTVNLAAQNGGIIIDSGTSRAQTQVVANSAILTAGWLDMEQNSLVHVSNQVTMAIGKLGRKDSNGNFQNGFWGDLTSNNGALKVVGTNNVYFAPSTYQQSANDPAGLILTSAFSEKFQNFNDVNIFASGGASDGSTQGVVGFLGGIDLKTNNSFTINAAVIEGAAAIAANGFHTVDNGDVSINAANIGILNRGGGAPASPGANRSGSLILNATNGIELGEGPWLNATSPGNFNKNGLRIDGFSKVNFSAKNDIIFQGTGSLVTGADNLNFSSARVTTWYYLDADTPYTAANFTVSATNAAVSVKSSGVTPSTVVSPGGRLEIDGNSIDVNGALIQMASGCLRLNGANGVTLENGAEILDTGSTELLYGGEYVYSPGGIVDLTSASGPVQIESGATVNVSGVDEYNSSDLNDAGVNAGIISIYSSNAPVYLQGGTLTGKAGNFYAADGKTVVATGIGGSFTLDTAGLSNIATTDGKTGFSALNELLANGGFNESLDIRSRTDGSLTIGATDTVTARQFKLTADQGYIDVKGTIRSTSDPNGDSSVELYAGKDLTLESAIYATGGEVLLSSTGGWIYFQPGASISFSGGGSGQGGSVYMRASITGTDVNMNLAGSITGAGQIVAEGFQKYTPSDGTNITNADVGNWQTLTQNFMGTNGQSIQNRLLANLTLDAKGLAGFKFVPGLEIDSSGSLVLNTPWDFNNWSVPVGMLTLRAAGDLVINQNLVDHPNGVLTSAATPGMGSWGLNLVAGADLFSANALAVKRGTGNLSIADRITVYSESAPIRFAAGKDVSIGNGGAGYFVNPSILYNLGTFNGSIRGDVGGSLTVAGGAIETALGDIDIKVGGDLGLAYGDGFATQILGSIRTTGQPDPITRNPYYHAGGGNITLDVGGMVSGLVNNNSDITKNGWDYANGLGQPKIWSASYNGNYATEGLATMGGGNIVVRSGGSFNCQTGTFGTGDLEIYSGGDLTGRFLIYNGNAYLNAMGNFGRPNPNVQSEEFESIEAFDAKIKVSAQGNVLLGAVVNPTLVNTAYVKRGDLDMTYSPDASVKLTAVTGDVTILGKSAFTRLTGSLLKLQQVMPGSLEIHAGGDIHLENDLALAPSPKGNLVMTAGGNIDGSYTGSSGNVKQASINVSDLDPNSVYDFQKGLAAGVLFNAFLHAASPLHAGDDVPVAIHAGGNIENMLFYFPKKGEVTAGGDIKDIYYFGQNVSPSDETKIIAAGSIEFSYVLGGSAENSGVQLAGPGSLEVQAGDSIDLGTSGGIRTVGNAFNPVLGSKGSSITVISGYNKDIATNQDTAFFDALQAAGSDFSLLMSEGKTQEAQNRIQQAETDVIDPFFQGSGTTGTGNINMTSSQISTNSGKDDIFILDKGVLNVGKTAFSQVQNTGIYTAGGGGINIFSVGDVNVNESRVMSFLSGDITVWSDKGNINAGRGSKTTINASPPKLVYNSQTGVYNLVFVPPAVGSGIRAVTYSPGVGVAPPPAGNIILIAPRGTIDAGEAGIAGRNVTLGAIQVLNASNISFSGSSLGVPVASGAVSGLTGLTGMGAATQGLASQEAAVMNAASNKLAQNIASADAFSASWLEVRVLSFFEVDPGDSSWESTDN